jgi:alpha-tubulin suppressor-like RCC1 family protein
MAGEKTAYHVLREVDVDGVPMYQQTAASVEGHSSADALKQTVKETGTYVAVPARSFTPTKVTLETQTVVKLGEAAAA